MDYFYDISAVPDPPSNLKVTNTTDTTVTISWDIPWVFNGTLKAFIISAEASENDDKKLEVIDLNQEQPTYNYTVIIINIYTVKMEFKMYFIFVFIFISMFH